MTPPPNDGWAIGTVVTLVVSSLAMGLAQYLGEAAEEKRRMEAIRDTVLESLEEADQVPTSLLMLTGTDVDEFRAAEAALKESKSSWPRDSQPKDSQPRDRRAALVDAISSAE
ncbi:MAG: hypothetical protein AAFU85_33185 [Planctomycetota bacterium]